MASRPAITANDLSLKVPSSKSFSASTSLKKLLKIDIGTGSIGELSLRLESAINRASGRIAVDLKEALDAALLSRVWSVPSGTADIYETGELLSSGSVIIDGSGLTIAYDAPYATLVHFGGYISPYGNTRVKAYLPPRPWVRSVLSGGGPVARFDFQRYYDEEIRAAFRV